MCRNIKGETFPRTKIGEEKTNFLQVNYIEEELKDTNGTAQIKK